jgi:hypothetical protein
MDSTAWIGLLNGIFLSCWFWQPQRSESADYTALLVWQPLEEGGERILLLIEIQGEESNSLEQVHIWRSRCYGIQNMNHTCPTSSGPSALVQTSRIVQTCQDYRLAFFN